MAIKSPVISRGNMTARFETVVKQEIAFHNKQVADSNVRLNGLKHELDENKRVFDARLDQLESYITRVSLKYEDISIANCRIDDLSNSINAIERKLGTLADVGNVFCEKVDKLASVDLLEKHEYDLMFHVEQATQLQEKRSDKISGDVTVETRNLRNEIVSLKSEIGSFNDLLATLGSQVEGLKKDVSQSVINSDLVKNDMKKKNKTLLVLDKKFEYVRDRIDRLRGKS